MTILLLPSMINDTFFRVTFINDYIVLPCYLISAKTFSKPSKPPNYLILLYFLKI